MDSPVPSEEDLICQTCGDKGFTNAFIYCVNCLGVVIHRYCLQVSPETFDEFVTWHCEDCEPSPPYHFTSPKHNPSPSQDDDPPSLSLVRTTPSPPYHFTSPIHDPSPPQDEDPPSLALVRTTPSPPYHFTSPIHDPSPPQDEDLPSLALVRTTPSPPNHFTSPTHDPSPAQDKDPPSLTLVMTTPSPPQDEDRPSLALVRTTRPRTKRHNQMKHVSSGASRKDESVSPFKRFNRCIVLGLTKPEPKSLHLQEEVVASLEPVKTTKSQQSIEPPSDSDSRANQITPLSVELDTSCFLTKGIVKRKRDTVRVAAKPKQKTERSIEHSSCESSCTDAALKNEEDITHTEDGLTCGPNNEKLVSKSVSFENESNGCAYVSQSDFLKNDDGVARPRLDPAWRGSFSITETDYDVFEGIRVHCSSKVGKKVDDEASAFPSLLSFEMHSKAHLWPNSFLESPPSAKAIAVYFLPDDTKSKRDFEQLVNDMIDKDLAMKTDSRNAELLIFTSKVLPEEYWRFQGKYYLWGVFKTKQNDVPVANHSENGNEVLCEEETLERAKAIESHSPQSPLCTYR